MNHWPSRRNDESQRTTAADVLRKRVDELLLADPKVDIIVLGDLNDEADSVSVRDRLRAARTADNLPPGALLDTTAPIQDAGKGTFVYKNKWDLLDHIIVSPGLLDPAGYHWKKGSTKAIDFPELIFHPRSPEQIPRPNHSYTKDNFHPTGYSDHLPVGCLIVQ
jgi:hypothetical protein